MSTDLASPTVIPPVDVLQRHLALLEIESDATRKILRAALRRERERAALQAENEPGEDNDPAA